MMLRDGRREVHDLGPAHAAASHGGMLHGTFVSARSERGEHRDEMRRHNAKKASERLLEQMREKARRRQQRYAEKNRERYRQWARDHAEERREYKRAWRARRKAQGLAA